MLILLIAGAIASLLLWFKIISPLTAIVIVISALTKMIASLYLSQKEEKRIADYCTSKEQARRLGSQILQNDVQEISRDLASTGYRADFEIVESIDRGTAIRLSRPCPFNYEISRTGFTTEEFAEAARRFSRAGVEVRHMQSVFFKSNCKYFNRNPYLKCAVGTGCEGCKDFEER